MNQSDRPDTWSGPRVGGRDINEVEHVGTKERASFRAKKISQSSSLRWLTRAVKKMLVKPVASIH